MGLQLNVGDHTSPRVGWIAIPNNHRDTTRWARTKARTIARTMASADVYFRGLPNGRSLTDLLADSTIWVNFDPNMIEFGRTNTTFGEIAIGPPSYRIGKWTVLATLIHELAHIDGAPGGTDRRAEEALLACGLGRQSEKTSGVDDPNTPYNPNIGG